MCEFPLLLCCVFGLFFELSLYTGIYDRLPYKDLYTALSMLTHRLNVSLESFSRNPRNVSSWTQTSDSTSDSRNQFVFYSHFLYFYTLNILLKLSLKYCNSEKIEYYYKFMCLHEFLVNLSLRNIVYFFNHSILQDCFAESSSEKHCIKKSHKIDDLALSSIILHNRVVCVPIIWLVISDVPVTSPTWNADLFLLSASLLNPQVYSHMGEFDIKSNRH